MPNHTQLLFLGSFFGVFTSLVLISNYLSAQLRAAGYDVSRIILIGLDTNGSTAPSNFVLPWSLNSNMTTQSTFDLKDLQEKGYVQIAALTFALLSSVFIYLKFGTPSEYVAPFGQMARFCIFFCIYNFCL
jgi:cytochrome-b5 reductase